VGKAKGILENLIGDEVIGYRAPTYSITKETFWALEILFELGFRYDSSIFPIKHDYYGFPEAPRFPFCIDLSDSDIISQFKNPKYLHPGEASCLSHCVASRNCMVEFPLSTMTLLGRNLPCAGGGYFRLFPYTYTRYGLKRINEHSLESAVFYLHPWEIDPELPMVHGASWLEKFRTYVNLKGTEAKLVRLLSEFQFAPLSSLLIRYWS
jgi:polysaccharide deacetylase family protein (PEP-CTERM system associated)